MNMASNVKTVLIGFADAVAAPEVFFSLFHEGFEVRVFQREGTKVPLTKHLPVGKPFVLTAPEQDVEQAIADLINLLRGNAKIDAVLALDDASLWLVNEAFGGLEENERKPVLANATGFQKEVALDKAQQIEAAKAAGLAVPATTVAHSREDILKTVEFPAIIKPSRAISRDENTKINKGDAYFLFDLEDLQRLPDEDAFSFPVLVQPLIHGRGEGVFGFAGKDGVSQVFGHQRIRMMNPHGSGASACRVVAPSEELVEKVSSFITSIGWQGPFMVELLTDPAGTSWFVELNGRLWGSTALACRNGYNYPSWAVEQAFDPEFTPTVASKETSVSSVRHLGREVLHLLFVAKGPKSEFHARQWPNIFRSALGVFSLHSPSGFYNFDRSFPFFFVRDAISTVASGIRRRKG